MTRLTVLTVFLFSITMVQAAPEGAENKEEFTDEQLTRFKAAEEEYKDNPALLKIITRLKEHYGITDEAPAPATPEPAVAGSRSEAENAYRNKDYETAMAHYRALAKAGDGEASLILGTMYDLGQGTDPDPAAAQAWFRKAAEDGSQQGREIMELYRLEPMSPEEQALADQRYEEITKEQDDESGKSEEPESGKTRTDSSINLQHPQPAPSSSAPYLTDGESRTLSVIDKTGSASLSVKKHKPVQHIKTTTAPASAWQPEKLQRSVFSGFEKYPGAPAGH